MGKQGLSKVFLDAFSTHPMVDFADKAAWETPEGAGHGYAALSQNGHRGRLAG